MYEITATILTVVLCILYFRLTGTVVLNILGQKKLYIHSELVGFFATFCIFQFIYVPMVMLRANFHFLAYGWLMVIIITVLVYGVYLVSVGGRHPFIMPEVKISLEGTSRRLYHFIKWIVLLGVAGFLVFIVLQQYVGWDTAFYLGNMNEALYTDTMYIYNGNNGTMMKQMDLRYALSGFSMFFSIPCYFLGISPIVMCYFGIRGLGVILALMIVYDFGVLIFDAEIPAYLMVGAYLTVNMMFFSTMSSSLFFMRRMNEAKGYCANVVLPMVALLLFMIYKNKGKGLFRLLFLVCLGSVGASMSSMMLVPALLGLSSVVIAQSQRKLRPIVYGIICALPNLAYAAVYLLNAKDYLVIEI